MRDSGDGTKIAGWIGLLWVLVFAGACALQAAGEGRPINPFGAVRARRSQRTDMRPGTLTLSDGTKYSGQIGTSRGKPVRIFDRTGGGYRDVPFKFIREIKTEIEVEQYEKEWRWKEGGSDVKVFTGRKYPWRKYITSITLIDDSELRGDCSGPIYVLAPGKKKAKRFILYKRQKGKWGMKLEDLKYVKEIVLGEEGAGKDGAAEVGK